MSGRLARVFPEEIISLALQTSNGRNSRSEPARIVQIGAESDEILVCMHSAPAQVLAATLNVLTT